MLTVIGFPRSGTNFLTRLLAHYIDGPDVDVWPGTPAHPKVSKIHWKYQVKDSDQLVYIYRDPRDCALSGREYIEHHYISGKRLDLMHFLEHYFASQWHLWPQGWREHTFYWLGRDVPTVSYEALCTDRERVLRELVTRLHGAVDEDRIAHAVEQSYNFGKRHDGRWVDELPLEAEAWIDDYCGDLIQELGYTQKGTK